MVRVAAVMVENVFLVCVVDVVVVAAAAADDDGVVAVVKVAVVAVVAVAVAVGAAVVAHPSAKEMYRLAPGHDDCWGSRRKKHPLPTEQSVLQVSECQDSPMTHFPVDFVSVVRVKSALERMGCHTERTSY